MQTQTLRGRAYCHPLSVLFLALLLLAWSCEREAPHVTPGGEDIELAEQRAAELRADLVDLLISEHGRRRRTGGDRQGNGSG